MSLLSGKVLLTGATGGIGGAIARALSARGADLILTGRRKEALGQLAREVGARATACDLSQRDQVDGLVRDVGPVDVFIANAAMPGSGILWDLTPEQVDRMLEVNLRAPIALARALAPSMIARGRGHMVFLSSLAGKAASPATSMYSATKFGLRGFALALREDLRPEVGVSTVTPGFIRDAGLFADANVTLPWWMGTRSPEDVADAVIDAVERNRAEIEVAPLSLRLGANFATVAPGIAAAVSRRMGRDRIALEHATGQRDKI